MVPSVGDESKQVGRGDTLRGGERGWVLTDLGVVGRGRGCGHT